MVALALQERKQPALTSTTFAPDNEESNSSRKPPKFVGEFVRNNTLHCKATAWFTERPRTLGQPPRFPRDGELLSKADSCRASKSRFRRETLLESVPACHSGPLRPSEILSGRELPPSKDVQIVRHKLHHHNFPRRA